jgi:pimeloyl-ACP methyl ester carboxylesterase
MMRGDVQAFSTTGARMTTAPAQKHFTTSDGVRLAYLEAGAGEILILVPGWSQTASMFAPLTQDLSQDHTTIAIDMRGHGHSDKPAHGYRLARLAADLAELIEARALTDITLIGHSMGCAVIWSYLEQYGDSRVSRLVLIDQAPVVTAWPNWSEEEIRIAGCLHTPSSLFDAVAALNAPQEEAEQASADYLRNQLVTPACPPETVEMMLRENLLFPRPCAARLLLELACHDWRDLIARIRLPTLAFGAEASIFHPDAQRWIAQQIPEARLSVFSAAEGGSHFMWLENPTKFLAELRAFLAATQN